MTLKDVKVIEDLLCKILIWSLNFHFFVIYSALFFTHEVLLSIRYRVHVQWSWTKILSQKWRWQQSSLKCFPSYFLLYRGLWDVVQMDITVTFLMVTYQSLSIIMTKMIVDTIWHDNLTIKIGLDVYPFSHIYIYIYIGINKNLVHPE